MSDHAFCMFGIFYYYHHLTYLLGNGSGGRGGGEVRSCFFGFT